MLFNLPDYSLIAAILPIIWAIYLKHTSETGVQIHINNLDYCTTISIRNGSDNALFIDEAICYKSNRHKYKFYSSDNNKTLRIMPGEECGVFLEADHFREFIQSLDIAQKEPLALKIKLHTSHGILTSGWIKLNRAKDSQYGYVFINSPRAIILRTEMDSAYSEYIEPIVPSSIAFGLFLSLIASYETMANVVLLILMIVLILGPLTFIKGFRNGRTVTTICLLLSIPLSLMLIIPTKDIRYLSLGLYFFVMIYLEALICSGEVVMSKDDCFNGPPNRSRIRFKKYFHRKTIK